MRKPGCKIPRSILLAFFLLTVHALAEAVSKDFFTKLRKPWPKNQSVRIVFHGHSVPAGYHKTPEVRTFESYPHFVHRELSRSYPLAVIQCVVTAIGGEDSQLGAARFEQDVLSLKPDLIFIDYGLNDRRLEEELVEQSWTSMIRAAQALGIPVVLITPTGAEDVRRADPVDKLVRRTEIIRALGRKHRVPVADVFGAWSAALAAGTQEKSLLSQINHPNEAGHRLAADAIVALLEESDRE
jgi:acyl-CoA thioesterase-1